jgi:hypothetical protein
MIICRLQQNKEVNIMARFTDKTIRTSSHWVKITRDNKERTFTFARGYVGEVQAHDVGTYAFKWVANWTEAIEKANRMMQNY